MTGLHVQSHSAECNVWDSESHTKTRLVNQRPKENNEQVNPQPSLSMPTQTSRRLAKFIGAKALVRCDLNGLTVNAVKEFSFLDSNQTVRHRFRCMYYMFSSRS